MSESFEVSRQLPDSYAADTESVIVIPGEVLPAQGWGVFRYKEYSDLGEGSVSIETMESVWPEEAPAHAEAERLNDEEGVVTHADDDPDSWVERLTRFDVARVALGGISFAVKGVYKKVGGDMGEDQAGAPETIEAYLADRKEWLVDAVELMTGSREGDPREVFPAPPEVRAEAPDPGLDDEQEVALREIASRFGLGGEVDVPSAAEVEIFEGGKPWKVKAEMEIANPNSIRIYAGSPNRRTGADEGGYGSGTECEMVRRLAELDPDFVPLEEDVVVPFGYKVEEGFEVVAAPTGQLKQIGTRKEQPVYLLQVDREDFVNDQGESKYRNQPDGAALMGIVSNILRAQGQDTESIGLLTSSTYASRAIDVVRAGLRDGRVFRVGMYGRRTLADVKGEPVAAPTDLRQIPGELHVIAEKLAALEEEYQASR